MKTVVHADQLGMYLYLPDLRGILPDAEVAASDETEEAKEFHLHPSVDSCLACITACRKPRTIKMLERVKKTRHYMQPIHIG
jgi:hypothetical protein